MVVYCGVEHQRNHWPVHSQTCMAYPVTMDIYNAPAQPEQPEEAPQQQPQQQEEEAAEVGPASSAVVMEEEPSNKPNQKTLDGREIYLPKSEQEPGKLSMSNLPTRGSSLSMEEGAPGNNGEPATAPIDYGRKPRGRDDGAAAAGPPAKKRRTRKKVEAPVIPKEPIPEEFNEPEEEYIIETLWKTTLGMLVFRLDKGYYGDGPAFDWTQGTKYLTDVKTKRTKGNKPVTEKWGKWCWDEKVYGPNNYGRFKLRFAVNGETFKGTWGWGSRNRGGGTWTGTFIEETRIPIAPQDEMIEKDSGLNLDAEDPLPANNAQAQDEIDVALCHAAVAGEPDKISDLIAQGANVNNRLVEKCTPVMHAVVMDYPNVVRALLRAPVDLNARDQQGCTPLHICAEHGHVECAQVILEASDCENMAEDYAVLLPGDHPLRQHPDFLVKIAVFASPLDTSLKNDAGQSIFDLIDIQAEAAPTLSNSRSQIAAMVREALAKIEEIFLIEEPSSTEVKPVAHTALTTGPEWKEDDKEEVADDLFPEVSPQGPEAMQPADEIFAESTVPDIPGIPEVPRVPEIPGVPLKMDPAHSAAAATLVIDGLGTAA